MDKDYQIKSLTQQLEHKDEIIRTQASFIEMYRAHQREYEAKCAALAQRCAEMEATLLRLKGL